MSRLSAGVLVLIGVLSQSVLANETDGVVFREVISRGLPIPVSMRVGEEKVLSFTEDVQWSLPRELIGIATGEAVAGNVYIKTPQAFESARFRFRGIDSNRYYVVDITASDRGEPGPVKINAEQPVASAATGAQTQAAPGTQVPAQPGLQPVELPVVETRRPSGIPQLTRYAFQMVYSPDRLIDAPWDVEEARLSSPVPIDNMLVGHAVTATPLAQWRTATGDYAIAVGIENQESRSVELDPRMMRRNDRWISLAMINDRLSPRGSRGDRTTIVIVADGRWTEVSEWLR